MAAGSSSRLGSPKQLLPWKKTSLIAYEVEKSLQLKKLTTFVVLGANFEIIQKEIKHFPVEILYNKNWKLGMGASISFGMQQILKDEENFDAVLITLADQPLIDEVHLHSLISKFNKNQDAIIATSMKDRIGVPAIFSKRYFKELLALNEDYGARQIIKKYEDHIITIDGKDKTDDIDTKEQYNALSERVKQ
nr:nucleotidyltransferase family protein [uncultured Aquimarina sp.]